MSDQQQYGLLPCLMQGGVNHETAAKYRYLVRTDSVSHTADIHFPYAKIALRNSPEDGQREVAAILAYESNGK